MWKTTLLNQILQCHVRIVLKSKQPSTEIDLRNVYFPYDNVGHDILKCTRDIFVINNINGNQKNRKHQRIQDFITRNSGPTQYVFYAILNTDLNLNRGAAAAQIARGVISLHSKLENDQVKYQYLDYWTSNGQRIIVLKGYDHKHLKYLEEELKFMAAECYTVRQNWARNRSIVMLAVFGQKEELEDIFEGLDYLR